MKLLTGFAVAVALALAPVARAAGPIKLVAAENFYGDIAHQIGDSEIEVTSIMNNPDQDPHLFETTPAVARSLTDAQIVVYNGADYDPWMAKLLSVSPRPQRMIIVVADLTHRNAGDNPHLWYDPSTMPAVAKALAASLSKLDPAHAAQFAARLKTFLASLDKIHDKIAQIRQKHAGTPVTATEPAFGYMAEALRLKMHNERFQLAVMNNTEPSARDIANFESDLKHHNVKLMLYNRQVSGTLTRHLLNVARKAKVPVVGITETEPPNMSYQQWMLGQLNDLEKALAESAS